MTDFTLRQELHGHTADVRSAVATRDGSIVTVSRDFQGKIWKKEENTHLYKEVITLIGHTDFVNCIWELEKNALFPSGAIVTGSTDHSINVWNNLDYSRPTLTMKGHTDTVSSIHGSEDGSILISGSYDGTCIVWDLLTGKPKFSLEGHKPAVLCVLILKNGLFATGGADKVIKVWDQNGKFIRELREHTDGVRKLIHLPDIGLLSCSNDGNVLLWDLQGECLQKYISHQNYCYGITVINGIDEFASCGEDQVVNIWKSGACVQSIPHPGSVWNVESRVNENGNVELITAGSDGVARIWTRDLEFAASHEQLISYEQSLLDAAAANEKAQKASTEKKEINGVSYDYVWNVDLGDGQQRFIGHNVTDDPFDSAKRFLYMHGLPIDDAQTIVEFINKNTGPLQIQAQPASPAPQFQQQEAPKPKPPPGLFPVLKPISFPTLNSLSQIENKIPTDFKDSCDFFNVNDFLDLVKTIKQTQFYHSSHFKPSQINLLSKLILSNSPSVFACLDLLRSTLVHPEAGKAIESAQVDIISVLKTVAVSPNAPPKNFLTGSQAFANLFTFPVFEQPLLRERESILNALNDILSTPPILALKASLNSIATILLNYSVLFHNKPNQSEGKMQASSILLEILQSPTHAANRTEEVVFRSLAALGTLIENDNDLTEFVNAQDIKPLVSSFTGSSDDRVKQAVKLLLEKLK